MSFLVFALAFCLGLLFGISGSRAMTPDEGPRICSREDIVTMLRMEVAKLKFETRHGEEGYQCRQLALFSYLSRLELLIEQAIWPEGKDN